MGILLYLVNTVRPDISFAGARLPLFCAKQRVSHWTAARRVLRYLNSTGEADILYRAVSELELLGFVDSEFAGYHTDRRSTAGYLFMLTSGSISWRSNKQTIVALSTSIFEYVVFFTGAKERIWLKGFAMSV